MSKNAVDILLVEDDRRLADLTAEYFEQNGFSVAIGSRGDQALSHFAKVKPRVARVAELHGGTATTGKLKRQTRCVNETNEIRIGGS